MKVEGMQLNSNLNINPCVFIIWSRHWTRSIFILNHVIFQCIVFWTDANIDRMKSSNCWGVNFLELIDAFYFISFFIRISYDIYIYICRYKDCYLLSMVTNMIYIAWYAIFLNNKYPNKVRLPIFTITKPHEHLKKR